MLPRSVAGTKRRHPLGGRAAPPVPAAAVQASADEHTDACAALVLNWISPWWCSQRTDALADIVSAQCVHIARLVATPEMHALGIDTPAVLAAVLQRLERVAPCLLDPRTWQVTFQPGGTPVYAENVAEHAVDVLVFAETVCEAMAHARRVQGKAGTPAVSAVYTTLATPSVAPLKSGWVVVDSVDDALLWDWDRKRAWLVPTLSEAPARVRDAAYAGFRCLPASEYHAREAAYKAWAHTLVQQNTDAARARPKAVAPAAYPAGTIVTLHDADGADRATYKAQLARQFPNTIDYVDVRDGRCYVRCATGAAADTVCAALRDTRYAPVRRLQGADEAAYWDVLPQRVRNAALRRAHAAEPTP